MSLTGNKVRFNYLVEPFYFPHRLTTKENLSKIFTDHKQPLKLINYIFCSDKYLLDLNKRHLDHNFFTDILTFDLSNSPAVTADVFISIERAVENASKYNVSKLSEIRRLLIHGALHLCGYKDKTTAEHKKMLEMEEFYLNKFFVSRETERATFLVKRK